MPRVKVPIPAEKATPLVTPPTTPPVAAAPPQPLPQAPPQPPSAQPLTGAPEQPAAASPPRRWTNQQLIGAGTGILVLVLLIAVLSLLGSRNRLQSQVDNMHSSSKNNSNASAQAEIKQITDQISQFYVLPAHETPTMATVTDITKVHGQAFFQNAQNGDKVLLYSKAGQAILYRPSSKKIIAVAPVNLNGNSGSAGTNSAPGTSTTP